MLFYISFADQERPTGEQWLGGCVVHGDDASDALVQSHFIGCNPGGEAWIHGPLEVHIKADYINRLLDGEDIKHMVLLQ